MKKNLLLLMLITGISGTTFAQNKGEQNKTFDIPETYFTRQYVVDLGKGNSLKLQLTELADLNRLKNIDSVIAVFLQDIVAFKDSLSDELSSKRIDYLTNSAGRKEIRIKLFKAGSSSFVIRQGQVSALKSEQDTINIIGMAPGAARHSSAMPINGMHYYRLSFMLNELNDLKTIQGTGLGEKLAAIPPAKESRWSRDKNGDWHIVKGDKNISANRPAGFVVEGGDYITSKTSVNIQNYKNYFVPSFSLGIMLSFNNGRVKRDIGLVGEPTFVFAKDAQGKLRTFNNYFITLSYDQTAVSIASPKQIIHYDPNLSISYLVKRRGDFFDKNTFRLGVGQVSLFNTKIKLEPGLYFNNLFKDVTPSLKLSVNF